MKIAFIDRTSQAYLGQWGIHSDTAIKKFFHNMDTLKSELSKFRPDCVFINKGSTLNYEAVRLAITPYKSVYFLGDYRDPFPRWGYAYSTLCDMVLFTWKDVKIWKSINAMGQKNIHCVHQGTNTDVFSPLPDIEKTADVSFGGGFYGDNFSDAKERLATVKMLQDKYDCQIAGDGWPSYIDAVPRLNHPKLNKFHNQARVTVGIHNRIFGRYGIKHATSNRLYQCMSIGIPHIAQYSPGVGSRLGESYLDWETHDDLREKIDHLLENPQVAEKIGEQQRKQIVENHTTAIAWKGMEDTIRKCLKL